MIDEVKLKVYEALAKTPIVSEVVERSGVSEEQVSIVIISAVKEGGAVQYADSDQYGLTRSGFTWLHAQNEGLVQ